MQQSEQNLKITLPSKITSSARTTLLSCVVAVLATAISHENYYYLLTEDYWPQILKRVSMGLTVRRKTAKNLAVRRKNERILAVSRKKKLKKLTVIKKNLKKN